METGAYQNTLTAKNVCRSVSLSYSGNLACFTTIKTIGQPAGMCVVDLREKLSDMQNSYVMNMQLNHQSDSCIFSLLDHMIVVGKYYYLAF